MPDIQGSGEYVRGGFLKGASLQAEKEYAALCDRCKTIWVDNVEMVGPIYCPNCRDRAVTRGITFQEAKRLLGEE